MAHFCADLHTHTLANQHAFSTIFENLIIAKEKGLQIIAMTDHGPNFPDSPHRFHYQNEVTAIPHFTRGLVLLKGMEANFLEDGTTDCPPALFPKLDLVIGNCHRHVTPVGLGEEANKRIITSVIEKGLVDIISHPADPTFPKDYEAIVKCAVEHNVALEINSSSGKNSRHGSFPCCVELAKVAKKHGAWLSIGSDAHYCEDVGNFKQSLEILKEAGISPDDPHIINNSPLAILKLLLSHKHQNLQEVVDYFGLSL